MIAELARTLGYVASRGSFKQVTSDWARHMFNNREAVSNPCSWTIVLTIRPPSIAAPAPVLRLFLAGSSCRG